MNKYSTVKLLSLALILVLLKVTPVLAQNHEFGKDGLKGLTPEQLEELKKGRVVFHAAGSQKGEASLIEAIIVFNKTPQEAWILLSKTEDQVKYIDECIHIRKISGREGKEVHTIKVLFLTFQYGVLFEFQPEKFYFHWSLDTDDKNDLNGLEGFWKLYPYSEGKTLARYGSYLSVKHVPGWIESIFKKRGVKKSLLSVKKYVDSGGEYRKKSWK
jgi:hypothetical protein